MRWKQGCTDKGEILNSKTTRDKSKKDTKSGKERNREGEKRRKKK